MGRRHGPVVLLTLPSVRCSGLTGSRTLTRRRPIIGTSVDSRILTLVFLTPYISCIFIIAFRILLL